MGKLAAAAYSRVLALFAQDFDLIVRGGEILDGTGNQWFLADIAVKDGRIATVIGTNFKVAAAKRTIDPSGKFVAPGFVGIHSHSEVDLRAPQTRFNHNMAAQVRLDIEHEIGRRGGARRIVVHELPDPKYTGKTREHLAADRKMGLVDAVIWIEMNGLDGVAGGARMRGFSIDEAVVCTDGALRIDHPRSWGTFPRKIRRYALFAGLVIFDPETIQEKAASFQPRQFPDGIPYVLVDGVPVVDQGKFTNATPGRVLTPKSESRRVQ